MEFDFDPNKSAANLEQHGIDFIRAQRLWLDPSRLEILARTEGEPRRMVIGLLSGKLWTAIVTLRRGKVRIISVRRSRKDEVARYEN